MPILTNRGLLSLVALAMLLASGCSPAARKGARPEEDKRAKASGSRKPGKGGESGRTPGIAGVHHPLERGQTLYALSIAYRIPVETLIKVNGIKDPTSIPAGTLIFIPGATHVLSNLKVLPGLIWPLEGEITTAFGGRGGQHDGIDIDGEEGNAVRAALPGRVVGAGHDGAYGLRVIIDHGYGLTTLYAHASRILAKPGSRVKQGEPIARVGNSGNANGTHLHFEVRLREEPIDPALLLP